MNNQVYAQRPHFGLLKGFIKTRILDVGIFLLFSFQSIFFNLPIGSIGAEARAEEALFSPVDLTGLKHLELPEKIGFVTDVYVPEKSADRILFILQDPHNNVKAQFSTAEIYDYFMNHHGDFFTGGYPFVAMEGSPQMELDYSVLLNFPVKEAVRNVSHFLVYEGRLDGTEYYKANYNPKTRIVGMEDEGLYFKNVLAFKRAERLKHEVGFNLRDFRKAMEEIKRRAYSYFLKQLDSSIQSFRDHPERLKEHFVSLEQLAKAKNVSLEGFRAYQTMSRLIANENKISKGKLNDELSQLGIFQAPFSFASRQETRKALARLEEALGQVPFEVTEFSETPRYLEFLRASVSLRAEEFFGDLEKIYETLAAAFAQSERERLIADRDRKLALVEKLWNFEVTDEEFAYIESVREELLDPEFWKKLNSVFEEYLLPYRVSDKFYEITFVLREAEIFYQTALARNEVLLRNALAQMDKAGIAAGFMVMGGFHAEGVTEILRKRNVPYVLLVPQVGLEEDQSLYWQTLSGQRPPLEKILRYFTVKVASLVGTGDTASVEATLALLLADPNTIESLQKDPKLLEAYKARLPENQRRILDSAKVTPEGVILTLKSPTGQSVTVTLSAELMSQERADLAVKEAKRSGEIEPIVHPVSGTEVFLVTLKATVDVKGLGGITRKETDEFLRAQGLVPDDVTNVALAPEDGPYSFRYRPREGEPEILVRMVPRREAEMNEALRRELEKPLPESADPSQKEIGQMVLKTGEFLFARVPLLGKPEAFREVIDGISKAVRASSLGTLSDFHAELETQGFKILGVGGFGIVAAKRLETGEYAAAKIAFSENPETQRVANGSLQNEFRVLQALSHVSGVPWLLGTGIFYIDEKGEEVPGLKMDSSGNILNGEGRPVPGVRPAFLMERIEGEPLDTFLEHQNLSVGEILEIVRGLLNILQEVHETQYIHRDVKEGNVLVSRTADGKLKVSLIDFGLVSPKDKKADESGGTPGYGAPEVSKREVLDGRSDIYSVGSMLYRLLTAQSPFGGRDNIEVLRSVMSGDFYRGLAMPSEMAPRLPKEVDSLIRQSFTLDRKDRFKTAADFAQAISQVLEQLKDRAGVRVPTPLEFAVTRTTQVQARALGSALTGRIFDKPVAGEPRKLGEGGLGTVWLYSFRDGTQAAIKLPVRMDVQSVEHVTKRFKREWDLMETAHGAPNLVGLKEYGYANLPADRLDPELRRQLGLREREIVKIPYIAMEALVDGQTATDFFLDPDTRKLKGYDETRGGVSFLKRLELFRDIALAFQQIHNQGVIHRDIKPHNIFLQRDGERNIRVRPFDLGLAMKAGKLPREEQGRKVGTLQIRSPELALMAEGQPVDIGFQADVYSLAATFYWLLTGQLPIPFEGQADTDDNNYKITQLTPQSLKEAIDKEWTKLQEKHSQLREPGVPEALKEVFGVLEKALQPNPVLRTRSAEELAKGIQNVISKLEAHARSLGAGLAVEIPLTLGAEERSSLHPEAVKQILSTLPGKFSALGGRKIEKAKFLAAGGWGEVYEITVRNPAGPPERLAIKIPADVTSDAIFYLNRERDALRMSGAAEVEEIVKLVYEGEVNFEDARGQVIEHFPFMVMEFVEGKDLSELFLDYSLPGASVFDRVRAMRDFALAFANWHEKTGLVHRDIKPSNLMMKRVGTAMKPVIMDPALAVQAGERIESEVEEGAVMGTPVYISPEQMLAEPLDQRADVYSLAASLYELLMGSPPVADHPDLNPADNMIEIFQSIQRNELREGVPRPKPSEVLPALLPPGTELSGELKNAMRLLDLVVDIGLEAKKENRYRSHREFATALNSVVAALENVRTQLAATQDQRFVPLVGVTARALGEQPLSEILETEDFLTLPIPDRLALIGKMVEALKKSLQPIPGNLSPSHFIRMSNGDFMIRDTKAPFDSHYAAPEQMADPKLRNPQADIFALSTLVYQMLTSELPYSLEQKQKFSRAPGQFADYTAVLPGEILGEKGVLLPPEFVHLDMLFYSNLSVNSEDRFRSADEFLSALGNVISDLAPVKKEEAEFFTAEGPDYFALAQAAIDSDSNLKGATYKYLASGAMGIIYELTLPDGKRSAMKILKERAGRKLELKDIERFRQEIRSLRQAQGAPEAVRLYVDGSEGIDCPDVPGGKLPYFVMEYVDGQTLEDLIYKDAEDPNTGIVELGPRSATEFPWTERLQLLTKITRAFDSLHEQGLISRDIKPENIMIDRRGNVRIIDLGLAADIKELQELPPDGYMLGTPHYMSPEQALGRNSLMDRTSDIYALGAVAFELMTGQRSVTGSSVRDICRNIVHGDINKSYESARKAYPSEIVEPLIQMIETARNKKPKERFQTAGEFAKAINKLLPLAERRQDLAERARRIKYKRVLGIQHPALLRSIATGASLGVGQAERGINEKAVKLIFEDKADRQFEFLGGQMGEVYRVTYKDPGAPGATTVVAKIPRFFFPEAIGLFEQETSAVESAQSIAAVVRLKGRGVIPGSKVPYMIMEYIDGPSLEDFIASDDYQNLSFRRRLELARDIVQVFGQLHETTGLVHRDIKPDNVIIQVEKDAQGNVQSWKVRLVNLGLALPVSEMEKEAERYGTEPMGTPGYWSPEQERGEHANTDQVSDIYGMGATLYEMISKEDVPSAFRESIDRIIGTAMAPRKGDRYQSAMDLQKALNALIEQASAYESRPGAPVDDLEGLKQLAAAKQVDIRLVSGVIDQIRARGENMKLADIVTTGGFGVVFLFNSDQGAFAVKVLNTQDPRTVSDFQDEMDIARKLTEAKSADGSPLQGVVQVLGEGEIQAEGPYQGRPFYVMELLAHSLKDKLDESKKAKTPEEQYAVYPLAARIQDLLDAAGALAEIHSGTELIHNDVKPANFMRSEKGVMKVGDYGTAAFPENIDEKFHVEDGEIQKRLGSPAYMAPETLMGNGNDIDQTRDIYSFGAAIYEMLTGQKAFRATKEDIDTLMREQGLKDRDKATIQWFIEHVALAHEYRKPSELLYESGALDRRRDRNIGEKIDAIVEAVMNRFAAQRPASMREVETMLSELKDLYQKPKAGPPLLGRVWSAIKTFGGRSLGEQADLSKVAEAVPGTAMNERLQAVKNVIVQAKALGETRTGVRDVGAIGYTLTTGEVAQTETGVLAPPAAFVEKQVPVALSNLLEFAMRGDIKTLGELDRSFTQFLKAFYPELVPEAEAVKPAPGPEIQVPELEAVSPEAARQAENIFNAVTSKDFPGAVFLPFNENLMEAMMNGEGGRVTKRTGIFLLVEDPKTARKMNDEKFKNSFFRKAIAVVAYPKGPGEIDRTDLENLKGRIAAYIRKMGVPSIASENIVVVSSEFKADLGAAKRLGTEKEKYESMFDYAAAHVLAAAYLAITPKEEALKQGYREENGVFRVSEEVLRSLQQLIRAKRLVARMA